MPMSAPDWHLIEALNPPPLLSLFGADPDRVARLGIDVAGLHFDWSKTHLTADVLTAFESLARAQDLPGKREALFRGDAVNITEGRAAEHTAERGEGAADSVTRAGLLHARMRALIDAIEMEALGPIAHILHIGIGGSALGPDLLIDALGRDEDRYEVAVISNVDGCALEEVFARFDPSATLLVIASKTFTTTETLLNASSALEWMREGGSEDPYGRVIALTAAPDKAVEWGIDETRVLPFAESVGGRYSLWSSIGFPAALALGWAAFEELLEGAGEMDRHFRLAAAHENAPMLAAFADLFYTQVKGCATRATFAYDERLRLLPSYLQQLEMESNGKSVGIDGQQVGRQTAPITWGGVGTDAQHAVFQLLHQGTHLVPIEFVAVTEPGDALDDEHHRQLLLNCFAQGAALMAGRANDADPARAYPGDRPSATILIETLDPRSLGALIAFYEHRTFVNAVLLGLNPFDQFGVELGKEMAKAAGSGGLDFDASTTDLMRRAFG
ncbi:MAG: glucose-6-phosphate isomerase [Sphingomonas sp.]|nr:glucose-6-phosphate isomerase [Sphingomonas sp.]